MAVKEKLKIALVGAGSVNFSPITIVDLLLSERLRALDMSVALMDIDGDGVDKALSFAREAGLAAKSEVSFTATTDLDTALAGADFVITAIEKDRYHYWSIDFHIPRRYGFRQIYGENGGPGGLFHALRNIPPMLHIARRMEELCPEALLINYTNPEAKLVEVVSKLTAVRAVGVCHGFQMGVEQVVRLLERPADSMDIQGYGLNHFGFLTTIRDRQTRENLYPLLKERERSADWMSDWDELALSRTMLRLYGLYPYPGANHIGEYIAWSDGFLASDKLQYFFDPATEEPWKERTPPSFVYSFAQNPTQTALWNKEDGARDPMWTYRDKFRYTPEKLKKSQECGVGIIEAVVFDLQTAFPSLNVLNKGAIPEMLEGMCVEGPCVVGANGVNLTAVEEALPTAITGMLNLQGTIHRLLVEAYAENSREKLLQAILLDPTVSGYPNAVALIDEMFERESDLLPPLEWHGRR